MVDLLQSAAIVVLAFASINNSRAIRGLSARHRKEN